MARSVPRSAPRSNPRLGGSNPRLGPYFRILTFSTAVFCYIQLASSSAVPGVPWDSHGELIVCIFSCQNQLFVHKSQILYTLGRSVVRRACLRPKYTNTIMNPHSVQPTTHLEQPHNRGAQRENTVHLSGGGSGEEGGRRAARTLLRKLTPEV